MAVDELAKIFVGLQEEGLGSAIVQLLADPTDVDTAREVTKLSVGGRSTKNEDGSWTRVPLVELQ